MGKHLRLFAAEGGMVGSLGSQTGVHSADKSLRSVTHCPDTVVAAAHLE